MSYFKGAPAKTYPRKIEKKIKCEMWNIQKKEYLKYKDKIDCFFSKKRQISNIYFDKSKQPLHILNNISNYWSKFYK